MKARSVWCALLSGCVWTGCAVGGATPAVSLTDEPPGANCPGGGVRVEAGPDNDGNGVLDPREVTMTQYVCDGSGGTGAAQRVVLSTEPPGAACAAGGVRIESGTDTDGSGVLDASEVTSTQHVCNGVGEDGPVGLTRVMDEPAGATCPSGGTRIESGEDTDGDGMLATGEVTSSSTVCNGAGVGTLTDVTPVTPGAGCANGGVRIDSGLDDDGDGVLDATEIEDTSHVCNGAGASGGGNAVSAYTDAQINSSNTAITLQSASIATSGPGFVLAVGSVDAYCASSGAPTCGSGTTDYYLRLTDSASASPVTGDVGYAHLTPNTTSSATRTGVFAVSGAGTSTYYFRAQGAAASGGTVGFWRRQISLVFLPN